MPLIWAPETTKLYLAMMKVRQHIKCIRVFSMLDPELISATTAEVSDQNRTGDNSPHCVNKPHPPSLGLLATGMMTIVYKHVT